MQLKTNSKVEIQVTEWYTKDECEELETVNDIPTFGNKYQIYIFGKTVTGKSCCVVVKEFPCYFYLLIPKRWRESDWQTFVEKLANKMSRRDPSLRISTTQCDIVQGHKFRGFTNNKLYNFGRLRFPDSISMKRTASLFVKREIDGDILVKMPIKNLGPSIMPYRDEVELYESNIDPLLRFIHIKNLEPCGWISVPSESIVTKSEHISICENEYHTENWFADIQPVDSSANVPLVTASFDIECTSSHGDFPQARKRFTKLAKDLIRNTNDYNTGNVQQDSQQLVEILTTVLHKSSGDIHRVYLKHEPPSRQVINQFPAVSHQILTDLWIYNLALESSKTRQRVSVLLSDINQYITTKSSQNLLYYLNHIGRFIPGLRFHPRSLTVYENKSNLDDDPVPFQLDFGIQGRITKVDTQQVRGKGVKPTVLYLFTDNSYSLKKGDIIIFTKESNPDKTISKTKILNIDSEAQKITVSIDVRKDGINENVALESDTLWWSLQKITQKDPYPFVEEQITRRIDCIFSGEEFQILPPDDTSSYGDDSNDSTTNYALEGDQVIQIGTCFQRQGDKESYRQIIYTLDTCDDFDPAVEVVTFPNSLEGERDMLLAWNKLLYLEDPDIITGYNIFAFDFPYLFERSEELGILSQFSKMSRLQQLECKVTERRGKLNSKFVEIPGRVEVDLFKVIQRDHNLNSYKLDGVSSTFIRGSVKQVELLESGASKIITDNTVGLKIGNYVEFIIVKGYDENRLQEGHKFEIQNIGDGEIIVTGKVEIPEGFLASWCLGKDDVSPQDIFRFQRMGSKERAIVAKYCVMDVVLCLELMNKLQIITNNIGMANVCSTPLSWIFTRGQGIKILSLVAKRCRLQKYYLPYLYPDPFEESYEGAIVLKPHPGIYLDDAPIAVLDYASLYPNSMRSENLSHEMLVTEGDWLKNSSQRLAEYGYQFSSITYDNFRKVRDTKIKTGTQTDRFVQPKRSGRVIHLEPRTTNKGVKYTLIITDVNVDGLGRGDEIQFQLTGDEQSTPSQFTTKIWKTNPKHPNQIKVKEHLDWPGLEDQLADGKIVWTTHRVGIIPTILTELLTARKTTRKRIGNQQITMTTGEVYNGLIKQTTETELILAHDSGKSVTLVKSKIRDQRDQFSSFQKDVLDGLQLAYKITANSLYGQVGAPTSAVNWKNIAASTTATGREQLYIAKDYIEANYLGSKVIYGDTDSIFVRFHMPDSSQPGKILRGRPALVESIRLGVESSERIKTKLKAPQDLEYEKTFMPFMLLSKKRYVGNKYEFDPTKSKQTSMGIVLKRRDNAPILKVIYGGIIDIIMQDMDINRSVDFLRRSMRDLVKGKYGLDKLIISKTLNGHYKNPEMIAHKVLADRMAERDPGTKPQINDRIPFIFVQTKGESGLQGDRIEHPDYIREKKLKPDYHLYVTNQIMKPVSQIFSLCLDDITGLQNMLLRRHGPNYFNKMEAQYRDKGHDSEKIDKAILKLKQKVAEEYLFYDIQREMENQRKMRQEITKWFPNS